MQWLDVTSRLRLARCSTSLLRDADDAFAWMHCPLVNVPDRIRADGNVRAHDEDDDEASAQKWRRVALSLVCYAPLHCTWSGARDTGLKELPHVCGLTLRSSIRSDPIVDEASLVALLSHESLEPQLSRLRFDASIIPSIEVMRHVAMLPRLATLHLSRFSAGSLFPLAWASPTLTDLRLGAMALGHLSPASQWTAVMSMLVHAREMRLKTLMLTGPDLFQGRFRALFVAPPEELGGPIVTHPSLARLRELILCHFAVDEHLPSAAPRSIDGVDLADSFRALKQLHTLQLRCVFGVDLVLAQAHHAPALRHLVIECPKDPSNLQELPSLAALDCLVRDAPQLLVTLLLPRPFQAARSLRAFYSPNPDAQLVSRLCRDLVNAAVGRSNVRVARLGPQHDVWSSQSSM
jgi:hypothetical protein